MGREAYRKGQQRKDEKDMAKANARYTSTGKNVCGLEGGSHKGCQLPTGHAPKCQAKGYPVQSWSV